MPGPEVSGIPAPPANAAAPRSHWFTHWFSPRLRRLTWAAVLGCAGVFVGATWLADQRDLPARWQSGAHGQIELAGSASRELSPHQAKTLVGLVGADSNVVVLDSLALLHSPRWLVDDATRERHRQMHAQASEALARPAVSLRLGDGSTVTVPTERRGLGGLGPVFWLLTGFAFLVYLAAMLVLLTHLSKRNVLFAAMSLCQVGNLTIIAVESTYGLGLPRLLWAWDLPVRMALDLITAAAAVHVASLYPRAHAAAAQRIAWGAWLGVAVVIGLAATDRLAHGWWWAQGGAAVLCAMAIGLLSWAERDEPHPQATQLRRIGTVALGTWLLLTLALAGTRGLPGLQQPAANVVSTVWYVFLASLLLFVPFLSRSRLIVREFALLATVATITMSLDLVFIAVFSLGQFAALALSLFVALVVYSGARQWIHDQVLGGSRLTTERMFEQLYRIAREVEAHPRRVPGLLLQLLGDLFEPTQAELVDGEPPARAQVGDEGGSLVVPMPALASQRETPPAMIRLRFAQHGRRAFTREDAWLTDRIVEQLRRAVAFDQAVEQGRREERLRMAQDLHDDIGARLLTLMYKAPTPEIEEYVRHTLKDLKTLTRGLAASSHRLSHAAAEWKADLTQRLTAADVVLGWSFSVDRDMMLSVVQWSALTRILRELVSNALAHAHAGRIDIAFELEGHRLELTVADNGSGSDPQGWSHGLGLGGVRKRVKQLGGEVQWRSANPSGIECHVRVPLLPVHE